MTLSEQQLYDVVEKSLASGDIRNAVNACRELNTSFPEYVDGWRIATSIHMQLKKPEAALISAERVLQLCPGDLSSSLQRLENLMSLERNEEAAALVQGLSDVASGTANDHDQIGRMLTRLEMHDEALHQYEKAVSLEPENAGLIYNIATAQRFLGRLEEAEQSLDKALAINRYDFEAQAMRSSLRKQRPDSNHVDELRGLLDDVALPKRGEANTCYALAKEYDDLDDTKRSFQFLERGAAARRRVMEYDVSTDLEIVSSIIDVYNAEFFAQNHYGDNNNEPVFVIGMPRTGTTLLERILGSHSAVHSAGELDNFGREVMRQLGEQEDLAQLSRRQVVERCIELNFARLGRDYVSSTRPATGKTPHFIDKLPFNYLYVGLIRVALPNAKIINLTRHPMATCYAVFKQFFRDAYPFSYDLNDLGQYFVAYRELMDHWNSVQPGAIHTVAYEDLVSDVEGEARRMLDFCELEWDSQVLDFYKSAEASTTASASQVRQPVYNTSVERWRAYSEQLQPVTEMLEQAGINT